MRFMLLHDNIRATDDAMKMFFMEVYELFIKVCIIQTIKVGNLHYIGKDSKQIVLLDTR